MEYEFLPVDVTPEKIKQYAKLLSTVFGDSGKFSEEFLNWQYAQNPHGTVVGYNAWSNGELAAHYVTIPVLYSINDAPVKGLLSLNTATGVAHQGKGLFTKLADLTYKLAQQNGYQFVIGVANQNSTHGFLKKLGFYLISPLDVSLGLGKLSLTRDKESYALKSVWDPKSLAWRISNPALNYSRNNDLILAPSGKFAISAVMSQCNIALDALAARSMPGIKMWIGVAEKKKLSGLFFALPDKLKPSPLNLIFKDLSGALPVFTKKDVFFELLDFDAY